MGTALTIKGGYYDPAGYTQTVASLSDGGSSNGNLTDSGAAATFTVNNATANSFSEPISGSLALTKSNSGALTLSGANSFSGGTTIAAGELIAASSAALGAAGQSVTMSGGTLDLATGTTVNAYNVTVSNTATITSDLPTTGPGVTYTLGTLTIGTNTLTININAGSNVTSGTAGVTFSGTTTFSVTPTFNITDPANGGSSLFTLAAVTNSTYTATFTGSGDFLQTDVWGSGSGGVTLASGYSGIATFNQANTYTGVTTIDGGTLSTSLLAAGGTASGIGKSSNAASNLVIDNGTLKYTGSGASTDRLFTVGSTSGNATLDASGSGTLNFTNTGSITVSGNTSHALTLTGTGTATLPPVIPDAGGSHATSLTKNGTGTWTLSANNSYTGTTTVATGTLLVTGQLNGAGAVTVNTGAVLGGGSATATQNIMGRKTITVNGALSPGNGPPGSQTSTAILSSDATNLSFASGSAFDVELDGTTAGWSGTSGYDQLATTGAGLTVALGSAASLNVTVASGFNPVGHSFTIITAQSRTGTFSNVGSTFDADGYAFGITYNSGSVVLNCTGTSLSSVTVGSQSGSVTYGTAGSVTYSVSGTWTTGAVVNLSLSGQPSGVTIASPTNPVTLGSSPFTLTLATSATTPAGTAQPFTLTLTDTSNTSISASGSGSLKVNTAGSSTAVSSSLTPSVYGQGVTFTATVSAVSPGAGTPAGTVQFKVDGSNYGSAVTLVSGSANSSLDSALSVGTHTITAVFTDSDGDFSGSTSSNFTQTVNTAGSSTAVSSSLTPSVYGQGVTFTATVSAVSPGAGTPAGTVQFKVDGSNYGSAVTLVSGSANSSLDSALSVGTHTITAVFTDSDGDFSGSTSSNFTQTVNTAGSSTAVSSSLTPSVYGQGVTFTATVSAVSPGAGTPAGTVQFKVDGNNYGSAVTLVSGSANSSLDSALSVGTHTITAVFTDSDGDFSGSTSSNFTQTVNTASSSTAVSSSLTPSVFGQGVTFTATVSAVSPGAGTPAGTVQFKVNGSNYGSAVTLVSGSANSSLDSALSVGMHTITAVFTDSDGDFSGSTSSNFTQTVNTAGSSTAVSSSLTPSVFGQGVTFTATVSAVSPGAGTPAGTVQFKVNGSNYGSAVTLVSGSANSSLDSALSVGTHTITAVFTDSDGDFSGSTSSNFTQTVNTASSSTAVSSSLTPSVYGQGVTFTATVSAVSPGAGTPAGTVQFKVDGSNYGSAVTLVSGSANSSLDSALSVGTHTITAVFTDSDGDFSGSTSSNFTQTVNTASSSTAVSSSLTPSVFGQGVTFTATVSAVSPGAGTPAGTVQFKVDGSNYGSAVTLVSGSANSSLDSCALGGDAHDHGRVHRQRRGL